MDSKRNLYLAGYTESAGAGGYDLFLMKYIKTLNEGKKSDIPYFLMFSKL